MRPRLLRVITRLNIGGPATHVVLANEGLEKLGWETLLIHGNVEPDEAEVELDDVQVPMQRLPALVRPIQPRSDMVALTTLVKAIRGFRPQIIHTHLSKAGLIGRSAAMLASSAPRVHTFHGTVFSGYFGKRSSQAIVRAERFLGHHTTRLIALSEVQRNEMLDQRLAPPERIRIVPLGLRLEEFRSRDQAASRRSLGMPEDRPVVLAIGRLVPIKRIDRLLAAFRIVHLERPDVHLYLVGDGPERSALEETVKQYELDDGVTFVGWSRNRAEWISASDVVALSSDSEGTPLALIEAAAAGRPAVATDVGGVRDVVKDGGTGFVVERADVAGLADRLLLLLREARLRQRLGEAAATHVDRFSDRRLVSDLDHLYRELLAERLPRYRAAR